MRQKLVISLATTLILMGCNSNSTGDKEKENLEKESVNLDVNLNSQEQKVEIKEVTSVDKNYLLSNNSAGKFKVGSQIPFPETSENYRIKKEIQTRKTEEGSVEETIYIVNEDSEDILMIKPEFNFKTGEYNTIISEIIVLSTKFKTLEGIGINSSINEFIDTYSNYNIWYTYVSGMYVIDTKDIKAQFILNEDDFTGKMDVSSDMTILKKSDFKPTTKIAKIRII